MNREVHVQFWEGVGLRCPALLNSTFLRLEALSNNLKDFGLNKGLDNLDQVRRILGAVTDRFAAFEAQALDVHVDLPLFQRLAVAIPHGCGKIPGIKLHDTRMLRLMEVLLHAGTKVLGWRTIDIHQAILICATTVAARQALAVGLAPQRVMRTSGMIVRPEFYNRHQTCRADERRRLGLDPGLPTGLVMFGGYGSWRMLTIA